MEIERAKSVTYLLQNKPWDLFIYVFETTDNLQHEVWHLLDETHPRHDPQLAERVMPDILEYYETVDRLLGEMVGLVPDDTLVVVLSDHGFGCRNWQRPSQRQSALLNCLLVGIDLVEVLIVDATDVPKGRHAGTQ